jgi:DNA invertase Pin-like site-specific DNA recombinase
MSSAATSGERDAWATLDDLWGIEVTQPVEQGIGPVAFYGRCSTEDNQDPETSLGWQLGNARKFVEPLGGLVVEEFFDIGQSRSVPWERRAHASRLLAALKDPDRGWGAIVVGEGTRCWLGNQFSLTAPKFAGYGVELWVPELGGKFEARNLSHKMLMSVLGGMSESERQHVQVRVRAAMDAQVVNEGRHQGGRAPYGYVVVDGGPHPNPRKAAEGSGCGSLTSSRSRRRSCSGSLRSTWTGTATGPSRTASTVRGSHAHPGAGRTRTAIASRTAGRARRFARS